MQAKEAYIVSSVRTAVGKAKKGTLRNMRPEEMGAVAVRGALERVKGLAPEMVDDVLIGCAMPEGAQGMNMGRLIAQKAGLPDAVPGATINRFCSSGLQTIVMATQAIMTGQADVIVAGGSESMSLVPMTGFYFQPDPDLVARDIDAYINMGNTAENVAEKYGITREEQDRFALRSHERAIAAIEAGRFDEEIVPLPVHDVVYAGGATQAVETVFTVDEGPRADTSLEALARLKPVFRAGGTVTAGNASQMSDGAAAAVVMSGETMRELGVDPMGRVLGFAVAGVAPELMGIGPVDAIAKVLRLTGLSLADIGLIELNEAFAAQVLAVIKEAGLDEEIVNVNGGAIALGHPLGCTGAKLTATLLHEMKRRGTRYGIVTMCIGGGMGAAAVIENLMR
ncbi:thiolase family protein [Rhodocaloribacter litoris]|uniref:thiolase family protein n=1 Tax=Rhodocaloribacter litoris TaxID=2558931 RepID=UPI00141E2007|nr:thiolase family protein [Rhodocaloribacter litoris]QXD14585.1 thiolase family protein [Rhodocaloribacter litoris]